MTRKIASVGPLVLALSLLLAVAALAADTRPFAPVQDGFTTSAPETPVCAPDRVLVQFTADAAARLTTALPLEKGSAAPARTGLAAVDALLARAGASVLERPFLQPARPDKAAGLDRWYLVRTAEGDMQALAQALNRLPEVAVAQPDYYAFPAAVPNDPLYADHWGHNNTAQMISYDWATYSHTGPTVGTVGFDANAEAAWDLSYGDPSVIVAIVDSGVDIYHEDLNCMAGYDFGDGDTNPMDDSRSPGHGTCCAGVAAAVAGNGTGVAGAAGNCTIMPLKVADRRGTMSFTSIVNALYYAADNGADVISMSLGAAISSDAATDAAIAYAYNAGCVLLAATGNENNTVISYPAINSYVIGVGAASPCGERKRSSSLSTELNPGVYADPNGYTCDGERWWGSNYGVDSRDAAGAVDVIAPTILPTTDISGSGGYDAGNYDMFFNGTSCATPYAAGVAALIKSAFPAYGPAEIRAQLCGTAQDVISVESGSGWDRYTGYGMVDAAAAVNGGGTVDPLPPVAAFTGTPLSGTAPLTVAFTDQSSNDPTSWSWTFGDGGTSTAQNPSHVYTAAGTYSVSLTVANAEGADSMTKSGYVTVSEPSAGGTMHVAAMSVWRVASSRKYYGFCDVTVVDDGGAPVSGATVNVTYTGSNTGTLSALTGTDGVASFVTVKSWATVEFCFTVNGVTHATLTYDEGANVVTQACESGSVYSADAALDLAPELACSPNPFNPMTEVYFRIPTGGAVRLDVYDVRGQVVTTLVDEDLASGGHVASWKADRAAAGVYFARLTAPGVDRTLKLILVK